MPSPPFGWEALGLCKAVIRSKAAIGRYRYWPARKKGQSLIYFDNAATTMQKPAEVGRAVADALSSFGGVGRGVHGASLAAGMGVYRAREEVAALFGAPNASCVAFTSNVTEALNIALFGLLRPGDHAIATAASHNSMLRPLYRLRSQGIELDIAPIEPDGSLDCDALEELFRSNTRVLAINHASNLSGDVYGVERLARMAHRHGAIVVLDAAQSAGVIPLSMTKQGIDVLCFTGHKSLYGPQGTGGLCVMPGIDIEPLKVGGSGTHSFDEEHPAFMPERLEAGTLNGHGIMGLAAGVRFVRETGIDAIHAKELTLLHRFEDGLASIAGAHIYGGLGGIDRVSVVAMNLGQVDSSVLANALNVDYGICTRAGAHCAPLMHKALGTAEQGAVRFSFSWYNTPEEVDAALEALRALSLQYA